jgi:hypothetical protein
MFGVTLNQLRINQLRKQHLLSDDSLSFKEIVKNQLGLHSTNYWTPYLSLFARMGDYSPKSVFQSLNMGDEILRINCFRLAVFVIHGENLEMISKATGTALYKYYLRSTPLKALNAEEIEQIIEKIRFVLRNGPLSMNALKNHFPELSSNKRFIFRLAMARGDIIRANAKNAKTTRTAYDLLHNRFPNINRGRFTEKEAQENLIFKYIERFGPVSENDISWWLPLPKKATKKIITNLGDRIMSYEADDIQHYIEKQDYEAASSLDPHHENFIYFLPYEDHFPKAFRDRWYVDEEIKERLFPRFYKSYWPEKPIEVINTGPNTSGEIRPSIWLNENIIGRWEIDKTDTGYQVVMSVYKDLSTELMTKINEKRDYLEIFINTKLAPIS